MAKVEMTRKVDFKAKGKGNRERLRTTLSRSMFDETAQMIRRIRSGVDVNNTAFPPLDPKYAAYKAAKGRQPKPDMTFTGKMLAAITHKTEDKSTGVEGTVFFLSAAGAKKARGNLEHRKFFGFSKEQFLRIIEKLKGAING